MRLWTLHPRYLDAAGLVALWREGLLARAVLRGRTRGYRHHPQLLRFRRSGRPVACINSYLAAVHAEAERRGYTFDRSRFGSVTPVAPIAETRGQLRHEWGHLLAKLRRRQPERFGVLAGALRLSPHPLFRIVPGAVREWERMTDQESSSR